MESDGGCDFIYVPVLKIQVGAAEQQLAVLLCPQAHTGYETRLFLEKQVPGKGANWRSYPVLGKTWWACSIRGISADQPYTSMLLAFLDHFK